MGAGRRKRLVCKGIWLFVILPIAFLLTNKTFGLEMEYDSQVFLQKCDGFERTDGDSIGEDDGNLLTLPGFLMTNSEDVVFRLQPLNDPSNYSFEGYSLTLLMDNEPATPPSILEGSLDFEDINGTNFNPPGNETYVGTLLNPEGEEQKLRNESVVYQPVVRFTPTGFLWVNREYFRPDEFCLKRILDGKLEIETAGIDCQEELTPCIPICCSIDKAMEFDGTKWKCNSSGGIQFTPTFYDNPYSKTSLERVSKVRPHFIQTIPNCGGQPPQPHPLRIILDEMKSSFRVLITGKVEYRRRERQWQLLDQYCLAGLQNSPSYSEDEADQVVFSCDLEVTSNESISVSAPHLYIVTFFLSSIFLFLTASVYILLWEKQNVHGWTVLSFVLSMFFLFIFLASSHLLGLVYHWQELSGSLSCTSVAISAHFFFLSTFCWLSVINFDLWWTFKSMAPISSRSKGVKRFCLYMLFAWGGPTSVISIGLTLQNVYSGPDSEVIVPDYGSRDCFLIYSAKGVYLYYIIGILLLFNVIFMFLTIYTIYQFKASTRAVDAARSSNSQSLSIKLFIKLFVVMGVTWILEFVSWWLSASTGVWYWVVFDMFNLIQSLWIFFIFVCKRKILNQLEQKYPRLKVLTGPLKKLTLSRRATRSITTTSGRGLETKTTGFSGRKFNTTSLNKI